MKAAALLPLDRSFLAKLEASRQLAYPFFRGTTSTAALSGPPAEFDGHRPYVPGDDIRWIDWNLYARLGDLYVKVFHVEEEVEVYILVDASPSMTARSGAKYQLAAACAAAFSYLAMLTQHAVHVGRYSAGLLDRTGPARNLDAYLSINKLLLSAPAGSGTDLARGIDDLLVENSRAVSLVVLSDGFQSSPLERAFGRFAGTGQNRAVFLRLEAAGDMKPPLRGNIVLQDQESADSRTFFADGALEKKLHGRIAGHFRSLETRLAALGVPSMTLPVTETAERLVFDALLASQPGAHVPVRT